MSTAELNPRPLRVSPFIKFCRWSLLLTGIAYGAFFQSRYSKKEIARREEELRLKPIRDAKLAEERRLRLIEEQKIIQDLLYPAKPAA
ncbi:PREDICTED: ATP synthase subunit e, mitochondrial [Dinoponera quadriceps]|uniref:ATP synthase F(0) complex subunit e, mitochondrial n=1 Tax=Dinoponera quadriceps TaxID=609295 RepID=A0A6P3YHS1_DINQU|nr:PREDICTED: ATP synthase subunit e, mitochondrial [Dinoponera quadriceps]